MMSHIKSQIKPILVALLVLVTLAAGTIALAQNALASSITLHNNSGSDYTLVAKDSAGRTHYIEPGTTDSMGTSYTVYVRISTCVRHGVPGTTEANKTCATRTAGTSFVSTISQWTDVVKF